ncbi:hypothetical protein AKJ59_00585 [candidate division MSBL1 archaeon SCGC-AAA385M02]|uniref:Uncharacterized protein n=1 Tax=candidate division MSBL1 archaeon SCGC-AAA385M02 TaxID=1698287 RepID=A0A133VQL8_9EURY|nr:hypothetical protein AKJ59_00585 [candidate division MSBL1 archaeon SCGC-AAA385M02]
MPAYKKDLEKVKELRETQSALAKEAGELGASAKSFQANVMDKVRNARAARGVSQLNLDIGTAMGRMATEPAAIRQRMEGAGPRVSPMQVDVATAAQRARQLGTLGTLAGYQQDISGTIQDVIGAGTSRLKTMAAMRQAEAEQKATEAANLMQQVQFQAAQEQQAFENMMAQKEYELAKWKARQPSRLSLGEKQLVNMESLKSEVQAGATLTDVMQKYGTKLHPNEILRIYNTNSPYGPAEETAAKLEKRFGIEPTERMEEETEMQRVIAGLESIGETAKSLRGPVDIGRYRTQRKNVGMWLARLVERGRLSDQDRQFYLSQIPTAAVFLIAPDMATGKLEQVVLDLQTKMGAGEEAEPETGDFETNMESIFSATGGE